MVDVHDGHERSHQQRIEDIHRYFVSQKVAVIALYILDDLESAPDESQKRGAVECV